MKVNEKVYTYKEQNLFIAIAISGDKYMERSRKMKDKNYLEKSRALTEKEMNAFKMSDEERQEAKSVSDGTYKSASKKELSKYKNLQADFEKAQTKPVLIRFDINDLDTIKKKAKAEGLPYQTYIKSIMHKAIIH
jgi:predicted DNA binding CopG/RHH family protein